jgi:hypothetical protein
MTVTVLVAVTVTVTVTRGCACGLAWLPHPASSTSVAALAEIFLMAPPLRGQPNAQ